MTSAVQIGKDVEIMVDRFSAPETLDCGQAFRWRCLENQSNTWVGVSLDKYLELTTLDEKIVLHNTTMLEYEEYWKNYFDLDRDYVQLQQQISADDTFSMAVNFAPGIRLLRQDPWETTCSFILSQNNNIKRIKGLVNKLCEMFGEPIHIDGELAAYAFPTAKMLASCTPEQLEPLRSGYRAAYIIDAAKRVADGRLNLNELITADTEVARAELLKIHGVGNKVADCILLFGLYHVDAFPKDVWIKRAMAEYFPSGLPECTNGYAGLAQQYLFHFIRCKDKLA